MGARPRGAFITFEGPEGSGKSTQARRLAQGLAARGAAVLLTREPGGTPIGDQIRQVILSPHNTAMAPRTEALLLSAARAQHVAEKIQPALAEGRIVICDRFFDSTLAYQGYGLGMDLDALRRITAFATGGLTPDLTIYLDCPVAMGLARKVEAAQAGGEWNRLDQKPVEYHERVRLGYLALAAAEPQRWLVIDAGPSAESIQHIIHAQVDQWLEELWTSPPSSRS